MRRRDFLCLIFIIGFLGFWNLSVFAFFQEIPGENPGRPEIISLLGKEHFAQPAEGEALTQLKMDLAGAWEALQANSNDVDNVVLYGRRLAYLWRYHEAIDVYSGGILNFPDDPMLYRHRGHRYISIRKFDKAVQDLSKAAELNSGDFDIWYHLGLAHYLNGDFEKAVSAYESCLGVSEDDESKVAVSHWLTMTLRRLGRLDDAIKVINNIIDGMEVEENQSYYDLLKYYKGQKSVEDLFDIEKATDLELATIGYGVGCWYLYNNDEATAKTFFEKIVETKYWPAFGFIAAEAELFRMK
ncbi:MAG: tetratricopeptide repeat protein [Candidatus Aminicenantes bacterium]|nr:tetratricopeptide repeat protein [Candidatus Aminicenantes bacterium]